MWKQTASVDFHTRKLNGILVLFVLQKCTFLMLENRSTQKKIQTRRAYLILFSNIKQNLPKYVSSIIIHKGNSPHYKGKSLEVFWRKASGISIIQEPPKSVTHRCSIAKKNLKFCLKRCHCRRCPGNST